MGKIVGAGYRIGFVKFGRDESGGHLRRGLKLERWSPKPEGEDKGKGEENVAG